MRHSSTPTSCSADAEFAAEAPRSCHRAIRKNGAPVRPTGTQDAGRHALFRRAASKAREIYEMIVAADPRGPGLLPTTRPGSTRWEEGKLDASAARRHHGAAAGRLVRDRHGRRRRRHRARGRLAHGPGEGRYGLGTPPAVPHGSRRVDRHPGGAADGAAGAAREHPARAAPGAIDRNPELGGLVRDLDLGRR